jgi:hypothetical protein
MVVNDINTRFSLNECKVGLDNGHMKIEVINTSSKTLELLLNQARSPSLQVEEDRMRRHKEKDELKTKLVSSTSNYKELL